MVTGAAAVVPEATFAILELMPAVSAAPFAEVRWRPLQASASMAHSAAPEIRVVMRRGVPMELCLSVAVKARAPATRAWLPRRMHAYPYVVAPPRGTRAVRTRAARRRAQCTAAGPAPLPRRRARPMDRQGKDDRARWRPSSRPHLNRWRCTAC